MIDKSGVTQIDPVLLRRFVVSPVVWQRILSDQFGISSVKNFFSC
jgi:hypothetical protein